MSEIERLILAASAAVPNDPRRPVLIYRRAAPAGDPAAHAALFERNGWGGTWRDGLYDFHHYHSEGHEVLGFARGWAEVILGGPGGVLARLEAGDVAALPAGTGHCRFAASDDLLVVGAYPPGQRGDIRREAPTRETLARIAALETPGADPVEGAGGTLPRLWAV